MGYCIHYAVREGMLRAAISGRAGGLQAERIAQDISEEAGRETVKRVLIDVRGLSDRLGSLGALSMERCAPARVSGYRVAVVDSETPPVRGDEWRAGARPCRALGSMAEAVRRARSVRTRLNSPLSGET
jgi:hypothetical protein